MKKIMLYVFTYVMVTLATAFGTIATSTLIQHSKNASVSTSPSSPTQKVEETDGEKLLNGLLTMGATNIAFEFDLFDDDSIQPASYARSSQNSAIKICFEGDLVLPDFENIQLSGHVSVDFGKSIVEIDFAYINNMIYLSNETMNVKLQTSSLTKIFAILPSFGINISIGDSFADLNLESLLQNFLEIKAQALPSGDLVLPFKLTDEIAFDIYTDSNYIIKNVVANRLKINNKIASLSAVLAQDETIEVENPEQETTFVDVTHTFNVLDSLQQVLSSKKFHLDFNADLAGKLNLDLDGAFDVDFNDEINAFASFALNLGRVKHLVEIGYLGKDVYLTVDNLNLLVEKQTITALVETISRQLNLDQNQQNLIIAITELVPGFDISNILKGDFSNININNLIEFSNGDENEINITLFGNSLGINTDINLQIKLDENDQFSNLTLTELKVLDSVISANLSCLKLAELPTVDKDQYTKLENLPNFVEALTTTIKPILSSQSICLDLSASVDGLGRQLEIVGNLGINFANTQSIEFVVNLSTNVNNKDIQIQLVIKGDQVYLSVDGLKVRVDFANIDKLIEYFKSFIQDQQATKIIEFVTSLAKDKDKITNFVLGNLTNIPADLILGINATTGKFGVELNKNALNLEQNLSVLLGYNQTVESVQIAGLTFNGLTLNMLAKLRSDKLQVDIAPEIYASVADVDCVIDALLTTIKDYKTTKTLATSINLSVERAGEIYSLTGDLKLCNNQIYFNGKLSFDKNDFNIEAYLKDSTIYLDVNDVKLSLPVSEIEKLLAFFDVKIDLANSVEDFIPGLDIAKINSGDWSSLTLSLIKELEITKNSAKLVIDKALFATNDDLEIIIGFDSKVNEVQINDLGILGMQFDVQLTRLEQTEIPPISKDYINLANINDLLKAIKQTSQNILENKTIAFDLDADIAKDGKNYALKGKIYADFADINQDFDFEDIELYASIKLTANETYSLVVRLKDGFVYLDFNTLKLKVDFESVNGLIDIVSAQIPDINKDVLKDLIKGSILSDLLNKDYSTIKFELLEQFKLTNNQLNLSLAEEFLNSNSPLNLNIGYDSKISSIYLQNFELKGYCVNLNADLDYLFVPEDYDTSKYNNLSGMNRLVDSALSAIEALKNQKAITLNISNTQIDFNNTRLMLDGEIGLDCSSAITDGEFDVKKIKVFAKLVLTQSDNYVHNINVVYNGSDVYLTYNNLNFKFSLNKLQDIANIIKQISFISESLQTQDISNILMRDLVEQAKQQIADMSFDVKGFVKKLLPNLDIDSILSGKIANVDFSDLSQICINQNTLRLILSNSETSTEFNLNFDNKISGLRVDRLQISNIDICGDVAFVYQAKIPEISDDSIYVDLNTLENVFDSVLNTAIDVVDNKHISFGLQTQLTNISVETDKLNNPIKSTETYVNVLPTSVAKFDWHNAYTMQDGKNTFDYKKMQILIAFDVQTITSKYNYTNGVKDSEPYSSVINDHEIEVTYLDHVVYLRYNQMYVKISDQGIEKTIQTLCEILGINTDKISLDNIKAVVAKTTDQSVLNKFKSEMITAICLTNSNFGIVANLSDLGIGLADNLSLDLSYSSEGLTNIQIKGLVVSNNHVDQLNIGLNSFEPITSAPEGDYIDLSGVGELLDAVKNTINYTDFQLEGNVQLQVNLFNIDMTVPVKMQAKIVDNSYELYAEIGTIPVIVGVNDDTPFKVGNVSAGKNRKLYIYIKDNMVYFYRTETIKALKNDRVYEKKLKVHVDTLLDDPLYYIFQYGFGFSDTVMDAIYASLYKERENPIDYSNVLKGFSVDGDNYLLTLNLRELTEDDNLDLMSVGINTILFDEKNIVGGLTVYMNMPITSSITILLQSNDLNFVNIGEIIDFSKMYEYIDQNNHYNEGAMWDAYDNEWELSSQREFAINFVTNCDQTLEDLKGISGTEVQLPELQAYYIDTETERTYYTFAGWYTSVGCEAGTEFTSTIMPRKDTTLYAKWDLEVVRYSTLTFETYQGEDVENIKMLAGSQFDLPSVADFEIETDTAISYYSFAGWFTNPTFESGSSYQTTIMPNEDMTLYAKYNVVIKKYITINFATNGGQAQADIIALEGSTVSLPIYKDILIEQQGNTTISKKFVGWSTDLNAGTVLENTIIMPDTDTTLYATWLVVDKTSVYKLTYKDNLLELSSFDAVQGEKLPVLTENVTSSTKYYLDAEYLNEIDISTFIMPSNDLTVYIRNEYALNIVSVYGNVINTSSILYQGTNISLQTQAYYEYDSYTDATETKKYQRHYLTFNGYYLNGTKIEDISNVVMPNCDANIVADWTVQTKNYYTITFETKTTNLSNTADKGVTIYESIVVLEGSFDLSEYQPTCNYTWAGSTWQCKFKYWEIDGKKVENNVFELTGDTTIEAVWDTPTRTGWA